MCFSQDRGYANSSFRFIIATVAILFQRGCAYGRLRQRQRQWTFEGNHDNRRDARRAANRPPVLNLLLAFFRF